MTRVVDTKFKLKQTILKLLDRIENPYQIQYIRISLGSKLQLKQTISIFWTKYAQNNVSGITRKSQHNNPFQHRDCLRCKFQLKQTIDQIYLKKSFSRLRKVNSTIEFSISELVYVPNLSKL